MVLILITHVWTCLCFILMLMAPVWTSLKLCCGSNSPSTHTNTKENNFPIVQKWTPPICRQRGLVLRGYWQMSNAAIISKWICLDTWDVNKQFGTWKEEGWNKIRYFCLILIFLKWSVYDINHIYALQIKNTSESDPCSYEATKAVAKKANLSFCCLSWVIVRVRVVFGKTCWWQNNCPHLDNHTRQTTDTPGLKPLPY